MDAETLQFARDHQREISYLLREVTRIREDMLLKLDALRRELCFPFKDGKWHAKTEMREFLQYMIDVDRLTTLQIDICIDMNGWAIQFFNCRGERGRIQQMIDAHRIPYRIQQEPWRLILMDLEPPSYQADTQQVADWVRRVLHPLIQASGRP